MKKIFMVLVLTIPLIQFTQADSRVVYNSFQKPVHNSSIIPNFPNEGVVTEDRFCFDEDKDSFFVHIEEQKIRTCIRSTIDHSDSTRPRKICAEYKTTVYPAKSFHMSRSYDHQKCVQYDYAGSYDRAPKCKTYKTESRQYPLYYLQKKYHVWDYRKENPVRSRLDIPYCSK